MQVDIVSTMPRPSSTPRDPTVIIKQTCKRRLVDLPCFGTPTVLVWRQVRFSSQGCGIGMRHQAWDASPASS